MNDRIKRGFFSIWILMTMATLKPMNQENSLEDISLSSQGEDNVMQRTSNTQLLTIIPSSERRGDSIIDFEENKEPYELDQHKLTLFLSKLSIFKEMLPQDIKKWVDEHPGIISNIPALRRYIKTKHGNPEEIIISSDNKNNQDINPQQLQTISDKILFRLVLGNEKALEIATENRKEDLLSTDKNRKATNIKFIITLGCSILFSTPALILAIKAITH